MPTYTRFKGFDDFGDSLLTEQIKHNVVEFFNWGFLNAGAFFNVQIPTSGAYGGLFNRLRPAYDPNYNEGQVWQAARQNWVWESGVERAANQQPIQVSGVTVDGTFYPLATVGSGAHHVDYPRGRIVFDNAISTSSNVQAEYSYRWINVYTSDAPWFREIMFSSMRVDDSHFSQPGSGVWDILADNRIQLPAVIVEPVPRRRFTGMQLGGGQIVYQDVLFHVFAEQSYLRDKLVDVITFQNNKTIHFFDLNDINENSAFPLNGNGSLNAGAKSYPQLVTPSGGHFWKKATFLNMSSQEIEADQPLFRAVVRGTIEINMAEI